MALIKVYPKKTTSHPLYGKLTYGKETEIDDECFSDVLFSKEPLDKVKEIKTIKKRGEKKWQNRQV